MQESSPWALTMSEMQRRARKVPQDVLGATSTVCDLAYLVVELGPDLSVPQLDLLLEIGSVFARQASIETLAALEAALMIERAKLPRHEGPGQLL